MLLTQMHTFHDIRHILDNLTSTIVMCS